MGVALQQNMIASQENVNNSDNAKNPNQRQKIGTQTKKYPIQYSRIFQIVWKRIQ